MGKERKEKSAKADVKYFASVLAIVLALFAISFIPAAYVIILIALIVYIVIVLSIGANEISRYRRKLRNAKGKCFCGKSAIHKKTREKVWVYEGRIQAACKKMLVRIATALTAIIIMFFMDCEAKDVAFAALGEGISHIVSHLDVQEPTMETFYEEMDLSKDRAETGLKAELLSDTLGQEPVSYKPLSKENYTRWKYLIKSAEENNPNLALEGRKILSFGGEEDIRQSVRERFDGLTQNRKVSEGIEDAYDLRGRNADDLSNKEQETENQAAKAQMASTYEGWEKAVPDISELQDVIDGRQELLEKCESGRLNFLLANDYQSYALEYQNRDEGDAGHILYYYAKSIYYAEQALRYAEYTEEEQIYIINYIGKRYKDIGDCGRIEKLYLDNGWANNATLISREILDYGIERSK